MMDAKATLKAITLELRHELEGWHDADGSWQPGDLERRLGEIGVWRSRAKRADEVAYRVPEDRRARRVVDAFLENRTAARLSREAAGAEFVRDAAYTWANRLLALRCMEARGLIDEVILQKDAYGGRSLQHHRLARREPERCSGEDDGLYAVLFDEFACRARELPLLFNPRAPEVALRPSIAALKRCIGLLSGALVMKGQEPATDEVFTAPDALGWAYQYWNTEEKDQVFERVRTRKGAKIEGAEIVPATCIYTEPYMVKFLVQNSLGAMWMGMNPGSRLCEGWEYYVHHADRAPVSKKAVSDITFLDPACGSGHFLIEAFELFYAMYLEEGAITDPAKICAAILERNVYGIDIDERAVQIAALALVMKAKERARDFMPRRVNLVATTNIRLPAGKEHLETFLRKHPEDALLKPALVAIFEGLAHADELGSLLQVEEPVDQELRHLRDQQLERERKAAAGTLFGPRREEHWAAWKHDALERLRQHFGAEAEAADLATAFFGEAASKGLSLVDLLAGRYDVVAANPPYMSSKYMGSRLRDFLAGRYNAGRKDLYAAFVAATQHLTRAAGFIALVTPAGWTALTSFHALRRSTLAAFSIRCIVELGQRAFYESGLIFVSMFIAQRIPAAGNHHVACVSLKASRGVEEKARDLASAGRAGFKRVSQGVFTQLPGAPFVFSLPGRLLDFVANAPERIACVKQGLITGDNNRFVRWCWETAFGGGSRRWMLYAKGEGYLKWTSRRSERVDWEFDGARIRHSGNPRVQNEAFYFQRGLTYSTVAGGRMSVRLLENTIFDAGSAGVFVDTYMLPTEAMLNSRAASCVLRAMSPTLNFREGYVAALPRLRTVNNEEIRPVVEFARLAKRRLLETEIQSGLYDPRNVLHKEEAYLAWCALLHATEGVVEDWVFDQIGLGPEDRDAVWKSVGMPAAAFPLLQGRNALPLSPDSTEIPEYVRGKVASHRTVELDSDAIARLLGDIGRFYQAGQGAEASDSDDGPSVDEEESEERNEATPLPAETVTEEIALHVRLHPVSVYWLLSELREHKKAYAQRERRRWFEDYVSTKVLQLLGHRWPREIESGEPAPTMADPDGIVPITPATDKRMLLSQVREQMAEDFDHDRVAAIEQEFREIMGISLEAWLAAEFFTRHISQFRRRPIAWQLRSSPTGNDARGRGKGRKRATGRSNPIFSCLVYYHCLDGDLLPKLRTHYIGPLMRGFQTELGDLEKVKTRTAEQDARRLELVERIDELKAFDRQLEEVIVRGYACEALAKIAGTEVLDKWTSRDGRSPTPASREAFLSQESRYDPDLNDGVRVNVAPLQRGGLLAADVLSPKDVEKAVKDRAEWRADERRWCREGKLPRPGWWSEVAVDAKPAGASTRRSSRR